jgi:hypothetical protein
VGKLSSDSANWLANEELRLANRVVVLRWWSNHTGWLVVSICVGIPVALTITKSWWFLLGLPIGFIASFVVQRILGSVFVAFASGRISDEGKEITWPGNLVLFVFTPLVLLAHLLGKI